MPVTSWAIWSSEAFTITRTCSLSVGSVRFSVGAGNHLMGILWFLLASILVVLVFLIPILWLSAKLAQEAHQQRIAGGGISPEQTSHRATTENRK
jgi:hypothetical protein